MTPPLVDPATAREQLRNADAEWLAVLRSFDAFEVRLRRFGDAAKLRATTLQLAELAGLSLPPRPGGRGIRLPADLRPGSDRPGEPAMWQRFDAVVADIGVALEVADSKGTVDGYHALHDVAHEIANAIDPPATLDADAETG
jgi:hypothetical protein